MIIIAFLLSSLLNVRSALANQEHVLRQYFAAVQSHDVNRILEVFDANAVIITAHEKIQGLTDIRQFYLNGVLNCANFHPEPGPFFIAQNEIAVEIILHCDGQDKKVGDFFTIQQDKITSMRVYSGEGYNPSS